MQNWKIIVLSQLSGMWRYRWWGLGAAWITCLAGWLVIQALPNRYESAAKVYIDTDTLMRPLMAGITVNPDVNQQIEVMMRTLITRPSVEQVAKLANPSLVHASASAVSDEVTRLQKNISLRPLETKNLFNIAYTDPDPDFAQSVTQSLVTLLVNSNLGTQRRNVNEVEGFLDQQIAKYEAQLRDMEKRRADFKTANLNYYFAGTATSGGDVSGLLEKAHAETVNAQNELGIEMARRDSLAGQLARVSATMRVDAPVPVIVNGRASDAPQDVEQAQAALTNLESRFTDNHPDVIAARKLVDRLKAQASGSSGGTSPGRTTQGVPNPVYINLQGKLADAETNVALQRRRLQDAQVNEETVRGQMAQALTMSREYSDLDRDYDIIRKNYQDLVARREAARLSSAVNDQQSDTVFRVIDPPRRPDMPAWPDRLLLNTLVLLVGVGFGAGLALILHMNEDSFTVSDQLSEAFDLPILGTVTRVGAGSQAAQMRREAVSLAGALAALMLCYLTLLVISQLNLFARLGGLL